MADVFPEGTGCETRYDPSGVCNDLVPEVGSLCLEFPNSHFWSFLSLYTYALRICRAQCVWNHFFKTRTSAFTTEATIWLQGLFWLKFRASSALSLGEDRKKKENLESTEVINEARASNEQSRGGLNSFQCFPTRHDHKTLTNRCPNKHPTIERNYMHGQSLTTWVSSASVPEHSGIYAVTFHEFECQTWNVNLPLCGQKLGAPDETFPKSVGLISQNHLVKRP